MINLPPDQRMQRILAMQPEELVRFRKSLSQSELLAAAEGLTPMQRETLACAAGLAADDWGGVAGDRGCCGTSTASGSWRR